MSQSTRAAFAIRPIGLLRLGRLHTASMCPKMSGAASSRVAQARVCTRFDFTMPMGDSMAALPHGEDIEPMDGRAPRSRTVLDGGSDAYRAP